MNELGQIESAVVNVLEGLSENDAPLFAVVRGLAAADRKATVAAMLRERKPAACVVFDRRESTDDADGRPQFCVLLAGTSLRGGDEVRLGGTDVVGAYELSDRVVEALHGTVVAGDIRLAFQSERTVFTDGKTLILEHTYAGSGVSPAAVATFDGRPIAGSASTFDVVPGEIESDSVRFGFPGIAGSFEHRLGVRRREIVWQGRLRAADNAGLNAIEATFETYVVDPTPRTMVDPWGRTYADVTLSAFERKGSRCVDPLTGLTVQDFVCRFVQLNPA